MKGVDNLSSSDGVNICSIPPILCQAVDQSRVCALKGLQSQERNQQTSLQSTLNTAETATGVTIPPEVLLLEVNFCETAAPLL